MSDIQARIAEVVRKHRKSKMLGYAGGSYVCICGTNLRSNSHYALAEHQAEMLAPLMGEVWESGLNTGIGYKTALDALGGNAPEPTNPYT